MEVTIIPFAATSQSWKHHTENNNVLPACQTTGNCFPNNRHCTEKKDSHNRDTSATPDENAKL
jgi:hypothetical protein